MNGGVSLAVWIGGVTKELGALRCASAGNEDGPTGPCYRELLAAMREAVRVDVVSGASAGGINGALLAAAVYAGPPMPDVRGVWLAVGDFAELLRKPSEREPLSLLRGDDYVLPQLQGPFRAIMAAAEPSADRPLSLFLPAPDFYGVKARFTDSRGREFPERDPPRVFRFQHPPATPAGR